MSASSAMRGSSIRFTDRQAASYLLWIIYEVVLPGFSDYIPPPLITDDESSDDDQQPLPVLPFDSSDSD